MGQEIHGRIGFKTNIKAIVYDSSKLTKLDDFYNKIVQWFGKTKFAKKIKFRSINYLKLGPVKRVYDVGNLITSTGRNVVARWLAGDNTYDADNGVNYGSVGTGTTTPADADTQLETETFRKVASSSAVGTGANIDKALIDFFYSKTDTDGTYTEFGTFIDAKDIVDDGQIFTHAAVNWVKSSTESLTIAVSYKMSDQT